jgi:DNA-binding CsgD family transcriptional regulator
MENRIQERIQAKTRDSQLFEIFVTQFEFSPKTAEAAINTVKEIYELQRFDPNQICETGKVIRQVISVKAKHGPRLRELPQVSVRLTVEAGTEDEEVFRQHGAHGLREFQLCRMAEEAVDQGGILTQEDLADILQVDVRTIRRTIKRLREREVKIQTRGFYHDIGPSISHKAWIVRLYLEYKTYSEIARTTRHSTTSIKRYITDFTRVAMCLRKGLSIPEIAHIAGISERLTKEYSELYLQYNDPEHAERLEDLIVREAPAGATEEEKRGPVAS